MTTCSKKSAEAEIQCFDNSSKLPPSWDSLIPQHHFLSRQNLAINEQGNLANISYRYLLISQNGNPVAAAHFQILVIKREHLNEQPLTPFQKNGWRAFTALFSPKLLIAGHLFRHDIASFYCTDKTDAFESYRLYKLAIDRALTETCASAVLVKDVPAKLVTYFQHYAPEFMMLRNDISMELDIDSAWQTINDYEKSLKHKYAQKFRKVRSSWATVTIKELSAEEVYKEQDKIYELYKQVCEKQPARIGKLNAAYIPMLKKNYPDTLKVWGIYKESELIGFYSAWLKGDMFDMFYIGFDYAYNHELQLYFNILFCTIEEAIKLGKKTLVLGRTALDAKARLGCKPNYLSTFLYIKNRFLRMAIQQLQANAQTQEGSWEQRHPFKETPNTKN